ncbi:hypothetical protein BV25DRAFT_1830015 [Artomyces pyxidatus]|uniref:Uncharacterized protein n=1 Tax=Artomyces pyxidatus TaxID=48021 RepID=A0ACB8SS68_9AGAM|nr:hypothetical protein BV25DRAFT_1830015 [Artomyces pyxidatus]
MPTTSPNIHRRSKGIHDLPVEILMEIFYLVSENALLVPRKREHIRNCMVLLKVCGHWRNVAHGYPRLWTTPPLQKIELTELALKYSGTSLLNIVWSDQDGEVLDKRAFCRALAEFPRVQTLELDLQSGHNPPGHWDVLLQEVKSTFTQKPAGYLETLSIHIPAGTLWNDVPIPDSPRLRSLRVSRCEFLECTTSVYGGLSVLELDGASLGWDALRGGTAFPKMIHALSQATQLEVLSLLRWTIPRDLPSSDAQIQRLELPRLHTLRLDGREPGVTRILTLLDMPRDGRELALTFLREPGIFELDIVASLRAYFKEAIEMEWHFDSVSVSFFSNPYTPILKTVITATGPPEHSRLPQTLVLTLSAHDYIAAGWELLASLPILHKARWRTLDAPYPQAASQDLRYSEWWAGGQRRHARAEFRRCARLRSCEADLRITGRPRFRAPWRAQHQNRGYRVQGGPRPLQIDRSSFPPPKAGPGMPTP